MQSTTQVNPNTLIVDSIVIFITPFLGPYRPKRAHLQSAPFIPREIVLNRFSIPKSWADTATDAKRIAGTINNDSLNLIEESPEI